MLPITTKFTNCTISNRGGRKIEWIVMHYFGGLSTALECAGWFCNPSNKSGSADFCVDDDHIIQVNPDLLKYNTWHCGGGKQGSIRGSKFGICKNSNSIGIEMRPYNDRGAVSAAQNAGWYFHDATVRNAADLVRYLMDKYAIPADHVIMHADVTGKYCPAPWLDRPAEWDAFKRMITDVVVPEPAPNPAPSGQIYRVRTSWEAGYAGQIGSFEVLENAMDTANKNPGYTVYDEAGNAVYPKKDDSFKVRIAINNLRIRRGPGTDTAVEGFIAPGVYTIVETQKTGEYTWGRLKSGAGWIALKFAERI